MVLSGVARDGEIILISDAYDNRAQRERKRQGERGRVEKSSPLRDRP